ncbi:uncharacterized protein LOC107821275 isoform X3 [Nicotiana tabacum]|uniref:Uncharacterized protein LOC107821275 isoform X3 n=2 Tax=Nicotiana tabacum TaxID=4097 RepID=A0AC58TY36_TOBAC
MARIQIYIEGETEVVQYLWIADTSYYFSHLGRDPTPSKIHLPIHTHGNDENLLLVRNLESYIKYYNNKHRVNMILISVKHITKLWEEKRKEEYMVLDLKQNATTCRIFVTLLDLMQYPQQYL